MSDDNDDDGNSIFDKITVEEYIARRRKREAQMARQDLNRDLAYAKQRRRFRKNR